MHYNETTEQHMSQLINPSPVPQSKARLQKWGVKRLGRELLLTWNGDYEYANLAYRKLILTVLEQKNQELGIMRLASKG